MTFVSHAQNYEDVTLFRALRDVKQGFYIDVGAFHPEKFSVTKAFYDRGWRGISVEPNPHLHDVIAEARPRDVNLCVAISNEPGPIQLTIYDDDALSTTSSQTLAIHATKHEIDSVVDVECLTLGAVWEKHVPPGADVHFLKLDMEGGESEVIHGFDWQHCRPWIVLVESTKPETDIDISSEWEPVLLNEGYVLAYNDLLNRFYVAVEHADLATRLNRPPSVHDHFMVAEVVELGERIAEISGREARLAQDFERVSLEVAQLREAVTNAQVERNEFEARYESMRTSTSWRVTRPLRSLSRFLRRLTSGSTTRQQ